MTPRDKAYHHGDLAAALLNAAEELLEDKGVAGLGLREVARRVGVSAMAPYRHFSDREALLAGVATRGFEVFGAELRAAAAAYPDQAHSAVGYAYICFAIRRRGLFQLMFGPEIGNRSAYPSLKEAMERAFERLRSRLRQEGESEDDTLVHAMQSWGMVHGLAHLILDGIVSPDRADALARKATGFTGGDLPPPSETPGCL